MTNNLRNWGHERESHYDHGGLIFCTKKEFHGHFLSKESEMNLKSLTAKMLEQRVQKEVDELNKRRRVIKAGLKRMAHRRAKKVFDALAAVIHEMHAAR